MGAIRLLSQFGLVTLLVAVALLVSDAAQFRFFWNILWMLGIPLAVAWTFDRGFERGGGVWVLTSIYLLIWAALSMGAMASLLGIGP